MSVNDAPEMPQLAVEVPMAARKTTNKMAVAGLVLSIAPLLGLIFSTMGLMGAKAAGGAGRRLGVAGIVLSLVFAGLYGFGAYELGSGSGSGSSVASDPGCVSAEASLGGSMGNTLAIDNQNLVSAMGPLTNAQYVYAQVVGDDIKTLRSTFDGAAATAEHDNVKSAAGAVDSDLATLSGDVMVSPTSSYFPTDLDKYTKDVYALYDLCGDSTGRTD